MNKRINDLVSALERYDDLYHNQGISEVSDIKYDLRRMELYEQSPNHQYFKKIGSRVHGEKVELPYPMPSLNQVECGNLQKFIGGYEDEMFNISHKMDGVSGLLLYEMYNLSEGYSRGDGTNGKCWIRHLKKMKSVPQVIEESSIAVRVEIEISNNNFTLLQSRIKTTTGNKYRNPRGMIAGIMNSDAQPSFVYDYIDVFAYEIMGWSRIDTQHTTLGELGFAVVESEFVRGKHITEESLIEKIKALKVHAKYDIDGLVIKREGVVAPMVAENPKHAMKYKIVNEAIPCVVTGIKLEISMHGVVVPVIEIEPTIISRVEVSRCAGFNMQYIYDNNIKAGSIIDVVRAGDTIPHCVGLSDLDTALDDVVAMQDNIDSWVLEQLGLEPLDTTWSDTGVDVILVDNDNPVVAIKQATNFFSSLDIAQLREKSVVKLVNYIGVSSIPARLIAHIIALDESSMIEVLGKNGKIAHKSMHAKLSNVKLSDFVGSLCVFGDGVGKRMFDELLTTLNIHTVDELLMVAFEEIVSVDGFEKCTAKKILKGKQEFENFWCEVGEYVTLLNNTTEGVFSGDTIVFSGFRDKGLALKIETNGGKIGGGVTKKTTFLVALDIDDSTGKVAKAKKIGIPIISLLEFRNNYSF